MWEHGLEGTNRTCQSMSVLHQCLGNRFCARWELSVEKCTFFLEAWLMLVTDPHEPPQAHGEKLTSMAWLYCSSRLSILVIGTGGSAFFRLLLFFRERKYFKIIAKMSNMSWNSWFKNDNYQNNTLLLAKLQQSNDCFSPQNSFHFKAWSNYTNE